MWEHDSRQCVCKIYFTNLVWLIFVFLRIWFFSVIIILFSLTGYLVLTPWSSLWIELFSIILCIMKAWFEWLSTVSGYLDLYIKQVVLPSHQHVFLSRIHHLVVCGLLQAWLYPIGGPSLSSFFFPSWSFLLATPSSRVVSDFIRAQIIWFCVYLYCD